LLWRSNHVKVWVWGLRNVQRVSRLSHAKLLRWCLWWVIHCRVLLRSRLESVSEYLMECSLEYFVDYSLDYFVDYILEFGPYY